MILLVPTTVAIAWLFYRPMLSLGNLAAGAALASGVSRLIGAGARRMPPASREPNEALR